MLLFSCIFYFSINAQVNYVPNGSFEDFNKCPTSNSAIDSSANNFVYLNNWYRPTLGTPDYYNGCNKVLNTVGVPQNEAGYQFANEGDAYIGLVTYYKFNLTIDGYREYIQVKLTEKLVANREYEVTFFVSPTGFKSVSNISALISTNKIEDYLLKTELKYNPQVTNTELLVDSSIWYKVSGVFKAVGGENWLTIGNFVNDNSCSPISLANGKPDANLLGQSYIYIDNVSLVETLAKRTFYLCNINDSVRIDIKNGFNKFEWFDGDTVNKFRYFKNVSNLWIKNFLADGSNIIDSIQVLKTPNIFNKIINDTNICEGEVITVKLINNIPTYLWNNNATDSFFTINKAGKYWVKAQENRCSRIDTFDVSFRPKPLLLNYSDTFFCKNESIEIGNINYPNNYTFIWNNGLKTKQITVNKTSVNILAIKDIDCWNYDTINVIEKDKPQINIIGPRFLCEDNNEKITLKSNQFFKNIWYPSNELSLNLEVNKAGKYWHYAENEFGCNNTDTIQIKDACNPILYMPNAFSPNADNLNDYLNFTGKYIDIFNIKIYNRWGEMVFETNDFNAKWYGTFNNNPLPVDVYFYTVKYASFISTEPEILNGTLSIIR